MEYKSLIKLANNMGAVALVSENYRVLKKKKKMKKLVGLAGTNIVGTALLQAQANL